MKIERIFWIILSTTLLASTIYLGFHYYKTMNSDEKNYSQFMSAINDTITQYKNKNNELVSRISAIQMDSYKDFIKIKFKDSLITELQEKVNYYKDKAESVTKFNAIGEAFGSSPTKVDTIYIDTIQVSTVYTSHYFDTWVNLFTQANKDSTLFDLKFQDDYIIAQLQDKEGDYIEIINKSPYISINNIRTFRIKPTIYKPKKWGIGAHVGYGISHVNNDLKLSPYFGMGVNYNIWSW